MRRVTEFVENMINIGRDADDDVLFSYASYPPTEYLLPTNMDFTPSMFTCIEELTRSMLSHGSRIWPRIAR